jgi:hypothetical protein
VALQPGDSQAFEVEASSAVGSDLLYTWTVDGDTAAHTSAVTLAFPEEAFYDVVCTVTDTAFASAPSSQRAWTVVAGDPDNVGEDDPALPRELALSGHPNPFNDQASLRIALPRAAEVELALYSITGRRVRSLALGQLGAGVHRIALDGAGLASGTYLLRLRAGSEQRAARLTLLR